MQLPFTHEAFLDVFGRYNANWWLAALLLWIATATVVWRWRAGGDMNGRLAAGLLAIHWAWSAVAYHWFFFRSINPAAGLFAAAFLLQAGLFAWLAWRPVAMTPLRSGPRAATGMLFVIYGLAYPFLGLALGLRYPRLPLFAVPCPTALVTTGFLLMAAGVPRFVSVVPLLWAVVGASAAVTLGIRADLALAAAALALLFTVIKPVTPAPPSAQSLRP